MFDAQRAAAVEQISKRLRPIESLKDLGLVDLDPWQIAAFGAQLIAQAGELLFLC
jgi:hypothetical protein